MQQGTNKKISQKELHDSNYLQRLGQSQRFQMQENNRETQHIFMSKDASPINALRQQTKRQLTFRDEETTASSSKRLTVSQFCENNPVTNVSVQNFEQCRLNDTKQQSLLDSSKPCSPFDNIHISPPQQYTPQYQQPPVQSHQATQNTASKSTPYFLQPQTVTYNSQTQQIGQKPPTTVQYYQPPSQPITQFTQPNQFSQVPQPQHITQPQIVDHQNSQYPFPVVPINPIFYKDTEAYNLLKQCSINIFSSDLTNYLNRLYYYLPMVVQYPGYTERLKYEPGFTGGPSVYTGPRQPQLIFQNLFYLFQKRYPLSPNSCSLCETWISMMNPFAKHRTEAVLMPITEFDRIFIEKLSCIDGRDFMEWASTPMKYRNLFTFKYT